LTGAFRNGALGFPSTHVLAAAFLGVFRGPALAGAALVAAAFLTVVLEAAFLAAGFLPLGADLVFPEAFLAAVFFAGAFSGLVLGS
jgi:hypothetical protein